jgi:avidin family protein
MKRLVTALVLIVATSVSAFAQSLPLPSAWQNELNSTMTLKLAKSRAAVNFTGGYYNRAVGFQCQYGPQNPWPYTVTGQANGGTVKFTVVWNNGHVNCHSTTVWTGTVTGGNMWTNWTLYRQGQPPIYGTDFFWRTQ